MKSNVIALDMHCVGGCLWIYVPKVNQNSLIFGDVGSFS
jgi:hypothetical protein